MHFFSKFSLIFALVALTWAAPMNPLSTSLNVHASEGLLIRATPTGTCAKVVDCKCPGNLGTCFNGGCYCKGNDPFGTAVCRGFSKAIKDMDWKPLRMIQTVWTVGGVANEVLMQILKREFPEIKWLIEPLDKLMGLPEVSLRTLLPKLEPAVPGITKTIRDTTC